MPCISRVWTRKGLLHNRNGAELYTRMEPRGFNVSSWPAYILTTFCLLQLRYILLPSSISNNFQEPIRFKVRDKEHTLGTVAVPLSGLTSSPNKLWLPLQPHKKASEVHGSLQVGCWVSSYSEQETLSDDVQSSHSSRQDRRDTGGEQADILQPEQEEVCTVPQTECVYWYHKCVCCKSEPRVPEVTGVSPNEGPVAGGQRVVLRGSHLGESREDIVQVLVAGVDCTDSVEYFSPCEFFYHH